MNLNRKAYGFEIKKDFYKLATEKVLSSYIPNMFCEDESGADFDNVIINPPFNG
jgi:tRNA1(Val) A37 N6-methylase TrmN6